MILGLKPISLQELKVLSAPKRWDLKGYIEGFCSLTPVNGSVSAEHKGNVLKIKGNFKTIVNLECDRCLQIFNQEFACQTEELIWLGERNSKKNNIDNMNPIDELMECIDPLGTFDPQRWVFEQLCLEEPLIKICNTKCPGPFQPHETTHERAPKIKGNDQINLDPRWAELKKLL